MMTKTQKYGTKTCGCCGGDLPTINGQVRFAGRVECRGGVGTDNYCGAVSDRSIDAHQRRLRKQIAEGA